MATGCFLCSGTDHWAEACWTRKPPASKDHHEARIALYRDWFAMQNRVDARQKAKLIENENRMWREVNAPGRKAS